MRRLIFVFFLLAACCLPLAAAVADVIYVKSGETLKGLVVEEHRDRIVLSTESGEQTVQRADIDEVFFDDPERNYLYLGRQALEGGNFSLAKGFFQKSLQIYPEFEEAVDALRRLADLQAKQAAGPLPPNAVELLERHWGVLLEVSAGRPIVKKVDPGSFAKRSGLQAGDLLVGAWGESLAFLSPAEVAKALLGPTGSMLKLTIERAIQLSAGPKDPSWPGMELTMERLGLTAKEISPKGAAASSLVAARDHIVKINSDSTRYLPLLEAQRKIEEAKDQGILLTIHRDLFIKRE